MDSVLWCSSFPDCGNQNSSPVVPGRLLLSIGNVGPMYVCCSVCHYLKIWSDCVLLALCNFTILPVLYVISTPAAPICHDAMQCIAICKYGIKVM